MVTSHYLFINFPLLLPFQVIAIHDDDEKCPPAEQESKKNSEEPMETHTSSNGDAMESIKEEVAEKEREGDGEKSPEGEETRTEGLESQPKNIELKGRCSFHVSSQAQMLLMLGRLLVLDLFCLKKEEYRLS